jgi:uncharacterized protein
MELKKAPEDEARARGRLAGDEATLKAVKDAVSANELAMKRLELDINTRQTSIARLKQQQFETRKNEEYRAIEHEIARYSEDVSKLEDEQLVLMEKGEGLRARQAQAQASLNKTKALVDEELAGLVQRLEAAKGQIGEVETDRGSIAAGVDESVLMRYDRLFTNKNVAVVPLENGICGGCHMKVTPTTVGNVKAEKALANCEQCGRILYRGD